MLVVALSETVQAALIAAFASIAAALISRPVRGTSPSGESGARASGRVRAATRRLGGALFDVPWRIISRLPPLRRERNPLLAATLGFVFGGLGPALYFRTQADVVIGLALLAPLTLAGSGLSDSTGNAAPDPSLPGWIWAFMALSSVYSFMRAHSSNRRLAQAGAPLLLTQEERNALLLRKLRELAAGGWSTESQSESQAVMVRSVPHHRLHLILTLATIGVWALVWIALALIGGERRVTASVDEWGNTWVRRAARPPRGSSHASV